MLQKFRKCMSRNALQYINQQPVRTITMSSLNHVKSMSPVSELGVNSFKNFTQEESNKIIQLVNTKPIDELLSYEISKVRADKLTAWKNRNGPLRNIQDILSVEGFGEKVAYKFYQSLLKEPKERSSSRKSSRPRIASFITPIMDVEQQMAIRSCVSLRIGVSSVTWARLELPPMSLKNSPCLLTHWQHHEIIDKKLHLSDLVKRCQYVDYMIPAADCYLFENPQMAQAVTNPGNAIQQNINIQKSQITAVLSYALLSRAKRAENTVVTNEELSKKVELSNIFFMRRFLPARLFNHLVGTERVSSEETILKLMRTYYNVQDSPALADIVDDEGSTPSKSHDNVEAVSNICGNVQFPRELREIFSRSERYHREFLGQVLLLNLAFVRLVLLQDPESLAVVTRNSNKDDNALI